MKKHYKTLFMILALSCMLVACSKKKDDPKPTSDLTAIATNWTTSAWGGVDNNALNFTIDGTTGIGTITNLGQEKFNFAIGDHLYFNIKANADGTYSAQGKFTYGINNASSSTRGCTLSLQNNGKQLTAYYPAITGFPQLTYIYQQGSITQINL
jgi:hypothetical protein